ncbi:ComEA family DNA-binding protein [Roseimarinus sediminis]|uniref:ComEA family DNA-binding protein n=1 Tax=Roseimarinus sediminis TaxID=1610899 RepID=UPI003D19BAE8
MRLPKVSRNFFAMSKGERNGSLVLLVLLLLLIIVRMLLPTLMGDQKAAIDQIGEQILALEQQRDSLSRVAVNKAHRQSDGRPAPYSSVSGGQLKTKAAIKPFPFDPNTISYDSLRLLGFDGRVAGTLIKFREAGAEFRRAEDLLKVYGVDSVFLAQLLPFIHFTSRSPKVEKPGGKTYQRKISMLEINTADSVAWTRLPGIGPVFASRICRYRAYLGGFVQTSQLLEVYHLPEETYQQILPYLHCDSQQIQTIDLNFADAQDLSRHPYCSAALAKALIAHRSKHGPFESVDILLRDSLIDEENYRRLAPYLTAGN